MRCTIADGLDLALGLAFVLDTDGAAASGWVGSHCGGEMICGF